MKRARLLLSATVISAIALCACGGSGPDQGGSLPPPAVVVSGAFSGTYTAQGGSPVNVVGYIPSGGAGFFADNGDYFTLPPFAAAGSVSGTVTDVAPPGKSDAGITEPTLTISGTTTGNPATAISGTVTSSQGSSAQFSLAAASPVALLSGTYAGVENNLMQTQVSFTVSATGGVAETDTNGADCQMTAQMAAASEANIYTLAVNDGTPSAGSLNACIGQASGAAFISSVDLLGLARTFGVTGPFLYLMASNASNGLVLELVKQ